MRKDIFRYNFVFGRVQQPKKILVRYVGSKNCERFVRDLKLKPRIMAASYKLIYHALRET